MFRRSICPRSYRPKKGVRSADESLRYAPLATEVPPFLNGLLEPGRGHIGSAKQVQDCEGM